jgi:hypothetical protein
LSFLALRPAIQIGDPITCSIYLEDLLEHYPSYTSFGVADMNGDLYCNAIPLSGPTNIANSPHFQHVIQSRDFTVGDYEIGRASGRPILAFGHPIIDSQGELNGAIFTALDIA